MRLEALERISDISPAQWDALAGDDDPFAEHAFLSVLEDSGSVGEGTGWVPAHLVVYDDDDRPIGAMAYYAKGHSYGEYIFDWSWANASRSMGQSYYPKFVAMTPVTPATGKRLLVHPDADEARVVGLLLEGAIALCEQNRGSSVHLNFLSEHEMSLVSADPRFMPRVTQQFHWHNDGYTSFDDFLARFRSSMRKKLRKERRVVANSGLDVGVAMGAELSDEDWRRLRGFYRDTCWRKGSHPYLEDAFFDLAQERLGHRAVVAYARSNGELVAASLNFEKGAHLYGRYWGCAEDHDMLHFELCYYQLIERAIAKGMRRFEAGAQGSHKLRRGLMPSPIYSAHYLAFEPLRRAIADFLPRETAAVERDMEDMRRHGPFRRDEGDGC